MELKTYLSTLDDELAQEKFAKRCGVSLGHLRNVICGSRQCGETLAIEIEKKSDGVVSCETMRPDVDWAYIRGTANRKKGGLASAESAG